MHAKITSLRAEAPLHGLTHSRAIHEGMCQETSKKTCLQEPNVNVKRGILGTNALRSFVTWVFFADSL